MNNILPRIILIAICGITLVIALPLVDRNLNEPGLIAYFNHDEGFLMDITWNYYSGEKRNSFECAGDYGVEYLYLAAFGKLFLSKFMDLTPGTFVLILRWFNLIFWIASFLVLWRLVKHHFHSEWIALIAVAVLAVRPAFVCLLENSKPDSMVLFFMILGIDYTMRIAEDRSRKSFYVAVACAAISILVKYAGIFLLPVIIAAMYFAELNGKKAGFIYPRLKMAWLFPALIGFIFVVIPFLVIFLYVRQLTGITWYRQYGLWHSFSVNRSLLIPILFGGLLMIFSGILFMFKGSGRADSKEAGFTVNTILSHSLFAMFVFMIFIAIFGFGWFINPMHAIMVIATTSSTIVGCAKALSAGGCVLANIFINFADRILDFDPIIFSLFFMSLAVEIKYRYNKLPGQFYLSFAKRRILTIFSLIFIFIMLVTPRLNNYHTLPFFIAFLLLILDTFGSIKNQAKKIFFNKRAMVLAAILLITDISYNARIFMDDLNRLYGWRGDIVFDITKWWRGNYGPETSVLADHPNMVYMPPEYEKTVFLNFAEDKVKQMRDFVETFKPELIYYNTGHNDNQRLPPIEEILPNRKTVLIALFDNAGKRFKRFPDSEFVIYKIIY